MSNPWDVPNWPTSGDPDETILFQAVGAALSDWESLENSLSRLFQFFVSPDTDYSLPAERAYGSIATSRGRMEMLQAAAAAFFEEDESPDDISDAKEKFKEAMRLCRGLSGRRNDIAHGTVLKYAHLTYALGSDVLGFDDVRTGYCLAPSEYNANKKSLLGRPRYIYDSEIIGRFASAFRSAEIDIRSIFAHLSKQRQTQ